MSGCVRALSAVGAYPEIYTRASSARQLASAQLVTPAELPNRELSCLIWDHCHVWQVTKNGFCGFSRYSVGCFGMIFNLTRAQLMKPPCTDGKVTVRAYEMPATSKHQVSSYCRSKPAKPKSSPEPMSSNKRPDTRLARPDTRVSRAQKRARTT